MVEALHLTRRGNTVLLTLLLLVGLLSSSWLLFSRVWTLLLCTATVLSYCATSFTCYHPDAKKWREYLSEWYKYLFVWALNYSQSPAKSDQDNVGNFSYHFSSQSMTSLSGRPSPQSPTSIEHEHESGGKRRVSGEEGVTPVLNCHKEAQKIIQLVMKDFIHNWYTEVTNDTEFLEDVQKVLEHIALEVNIRLQQMNLEELIVDLLTLILPYLEVLNKAGCRNYNGGVELFDVNNEKCLKEFEASPKARHYAMRSRAAEKQHFRQILDVLIQTAFPPEYARCDSACTFVRELLLKNIMGPLFDLLCDPAFLYTSIPMILSKAAPEKIRRQLDAILKENKELDRMLNRGRLIVSGTGSKERNKRRFHSSSGCFGRSAKLPVTSLSSTTRSTLARPHSIAALPGLCRTSSGIYESGSWLSQSTRVSSTSPNLHKGIDGDGEDETTYSPSGPSQSRRAMFTLRTGGINLYDSSAGGLPETLRDETSEKEEEEEEEDYNSCDYMVMDGEFAVVELAPIYIERHVRVVRESGSHIAYIFKVREA